MGHRDLLVTQTYLSPQTTTVLLTSRVASAAGRLGSNGLLGSAWDTGAVHEDDLPSACLFFQEGRFQPVLVSGAGRVGDAAFIGVGNPSSVTADVDVRFGHVPFIPPACGVLGFDETHDGVAVESRASIKYVKVRCNHGVELRNIVCAGCNEYCADCVYDLSLIGGEGFLLGSRSRDVRRKD